MAISKIERRREQLNAYADLIEKANLSLDFESNVIAGKYDWVNEEAIERAKIRAETLHDIITMLDNAAGN